MSSVETNLLSSCLESDRASNTVWFNTGLVILEHKEDFESVETNKEKTDIFCGYLREDADQSLIPEVGLDRKGNSITLRKKTGEIKFSSWEVTSRMIQNLSDIWKGISALGFDVVFEEGRLIPRSRLLKLLKEESKTANTTNTTETPAEIIKRCLELATSKMKELEGVDEATIGSVEQRIIDLSLAWSDIKG